MTVAIACEPEEPRATVDACRIDVTGANLHAGASDPNAYPVQAEQKYVLQFRDGDGNEVGRSYVFSPDHAGAHSFPNYVWPGAGDSDADIRLLKAADDSVVATQAVNVLSPEGDDLS